MKKVMKNNIIIVSIVLLILTPIVLFFYLPTTPEEAILKRRDEAFVLDTIIDEISIDKDYSVTLYINKKGYLNSAVIEKILWFYIVDEFSGNISPIAPHELEIGDTRVSLISSFYDKGTKYISYGVIKDNSISKVVYNNEPLREIHFNDLRIVYGFGDEITFTAQYDLYDQEGNILKHIK
ncbi:MAG: hypothetical protein RR636_11435 [Clostridium sp.]|uniref:hypothetical protein n=1 Tax=Clostridium sp. TaxID=1506 RepID=UPI00304E94B0